MKRGSKHGVAGFLEEKPVCAPSLRSGLEDWDSICYAPSTQGDTMPRANPEERLRKIEEKQARLKAEAQRLKARTRQNRRKRENRRKILAGAMLLDSVEQGDFPEKLFLSHMDKFLTRDHERALFDLPPRAAKSQPDG